MRKKLRITLFMAVIMAVSTAVVIGCSDDDDNPVSSQSNVLMPLDVGNSWTYRQITFQYPDNSSSISDKGMTISKDTLRDGETWFRIGDDEYINKSDGLHIMKYNFFGTYGPIIYRYPATVGDAYNNPDIQGSSYITVTDLAKPINVIAGEFTCIGYKSVVNIGEDTWTTHTYFAPDTGIVLKKVYNIRSENDTILYRHEELTDLNLN